MTPEFYISYALTPALRLLPSRMDTDAARAMVVAICLQESRLKHRHQVGGPAHGYGQFEQGGGVRGVLTHPASKPHIQSVLTALDYDPASDAEACFIAIEHNDILMSAFCRLNLWWLPDKLPARNAPAVGLSQYLSAWRPGKPRPGDWPENFETAWEIVV